MAFNYAEMKIDDTVSYKILPDNELINHSFDDLYPIIDGKLIYGEFVIDKAEIKLIKLEKLPVIYNRYKYTGYNNNMFVFVNVSDTNDTLKYRANKIASILPYIDNGNITMKQYYFWTIANNKVVQIWGDHVP